MPRRLRVYVAVVAGALAAGVPVALIHRGLDAYIERQASDEIRLAAQATVARAEWRIGQSIAALEAVGKKSLRTCVDVDLDLVRHSVMSTTPIKEIAVVDEVGDSRCLPSGIVAPVPAVSRVWKKTPFRGVTNNVAITASALLLLERTIRPASALSLVSCS